MYNCKNRGIRRYQRMTNDELRRWSNELKPIKKPQTVEDIKNYNADDRVLRDMRTLHKSMKNVMINQ